jgi:hypothetical protein
MCGKLCAGRRQLISGVRRLVVIRESLKRWREYCDRASLIRDYGIPSARPTLNGSGFARLCSNGMIGHVQLVVIAP